MESQHAFHHLSASIYVIHVFLFFWHTCHLCALNLMKCCFFFHACAQENGIFKCFIYQLCLRLTILAVNICITLKLLCKSFSRNTVNVIWARHKKGEFGATTSCVIAASQQSDPSKFALICTIDKVRLSSHTCLSFLCSLSVCREQKYPTTWMWSSHHHISTVAHRKMSHREASCLFFHCSLGPFSSDQQSADYFYLTFSFFSPPYLCCDSTPLIVWGEVNTFQICTSVLFPAGIHGH